MTRYNVRYLDRSGNGWTRELYAEDVRSAIRQAAADADIHRIVSVLPTGCLA